MYFINPYVDNYSSFYIFPYVETGMAYSKETLDIKLYLNMFVPLKELALGVEILFD